METRSANAGFSVVAATGPNICRICLTNGGTGKQGQVQGLESIFSTVVDYECKSLYGILLEVCAPLGTREMLNGMPERICRGCKWRLLTAYELYETCLRSDEKMREVSAREIQLKQAMQVEKKEEQQVVIKQELPDGDEQPSSQHTENDTTMEDYSDASALLLESQFYPDAESSLVAPSPNLLEEMAPAVDLQETFFEEHYQPGENGNHKCGICEAEFQYKSAARTHILQKHDPSKPFKCDVCFISLTTELRLIRHKALGHGVGVIKCDQSAEDKDESGATIYTCKICSKTFTSMVRFKRHKNVHVAYNRPFKCDVCLYRFSTRSQLQQHAKTHQEKPEGTDQPDQDQWPCEFCEEKLPNKRAQTMHVRRFHPEQSLAVESPAGTATSTGSDKNEYKCIICSEAFARESVLNTHMKMHELIALEKEKEQRQQQLEAMLNKREQQQQQQNSALDSSTTAVGAISFNESLTTMASGKKRSDADMLFVCIVCEQEFEERDMLLKHQKRLHKELELNIVSSGAAQEQQDGAAEEAPVDDLEDSARTKDPEQTQDESMVVDLDPIEFLATENGQTKPRGGSGGPPSLPKCELCGKTFMYNCLLQTHIKKSHSESKPFECKTCHMRFGYRGTLQKHELSHSAQNVRAGGHGSIMYKCKLCGAKFLEQKLLTFHLRTHRSAPPTPTQKAEPEPPTTKKVEIFACGFCPQIFNAKDEFDRHLVNVHRQTPAPPPLKPAPGINRNSPTPAAARKTAERRTPMNEKETFFDSLSIVKLEHPLGTVKLD
ncbi:zinc finger protein 808 [Culex quinquefasciatus]|uniref:zinc finger protein 808 n=1 Tax=Culex quinquefasciatus TaxID=7176 RepID=UPI0018E2EA80|nr:zinc finger protein 808 [Culex quinquefasciatus]